MSADRPEPNAAAAGTFAIGGDLTVNRLGFGAMRTIGPRALGEPADREQAVSVIRRALGLGVTLIDTAASYGPGVSEALLAEALYPYPNELVIATKGGFVRRRGGWIPNGQPEHLRAAVEGSLRRLRLSRIDLYQLHTVDPRISIEDSVGALVGLQAQGKIRHIGVSNVSVGELARARRVARVVSVQNRYNLLDRESDDVVEICERDGVAFLPWDPLRTGVLARRPPRPLEHISHRHGATAAQVALAWLLKRSPVILPIPGTSSISHLEENVAAVRVELRREEFETLRGLS
jgi:aryl-alcohol dehydrogenase-like predicted oxidoreductase